MEEDYNVFDPIDLNQFAEIEFVASIHFINLLSECSDF